LGKFATAQIKFGFKIETTSLKFGYTSKLILTFVNINLVMLVSAFQL